MNLSKQQQQAYSRLSDALDVMTDVIDDPLVIREKMKPRIEKFIAETGGEIKVKLVGAGVPTIALIDLSKDSMKTSLDASQTLNLRARFESVLISVTAAYKGTYAHDNETIADALLGMSEKIRALPFEVVAQGACNIDELLGLTHSNAGDSDDEDHADLAPAPAPAGGVLAPAGAGDDAIDVTPGFTPVAATTAAPVVAKPAAEAAEVIDSSEAQEPADEAVIQLVAVISDRPREEDEEDDSQV